MKAGDLLKISCGESGALLGQVLLIDLTFYMRVVDIRVPDSDVLDIDVSKANTVLIGETTDGELVRGNWSVVGTAPVPADYLRPFNVVGTSEGLLLRNFDGQVVRSASQKDFEYYGYKVSVSSSRFTAEVCSYLEQGLKGDFGSIDARRVAKRSFLID